MIHRFNLGRLAAVGILALGLGMLGRGTASASFVAGPIPEAGFVDIAGAGGGATAGATASAAGGASASAGAGASTAAGVGTTAGATGAAAAGTTAAGSAVGVGAVSQGYTVVGPGGAVAGTDIVKPALRPDIPFGGIIIGSGPCPITTLGLPAWYFLEYDYRLHLLIPLVIVPVSRVNMWWAPFFGNADLGTFFPVPGLCIFPLSSGAFFVAPFAGTVTPFPFAGIGTSLFPPIIGKAVGV